MARRDTAFYLCIILTLACGFSSNFVSNVTPAALGLPLALTFWVTKVLALVLPATLAYFRALSVRRVWGLLVVFELLSIAPGISGLPSTVVQGMTAGLSIAVTGSALFLLPRERMRSGIVLGFSLSMALVPLLRLVLGDHSDLAPDVLSLLYLGALIPVMGRTGSCPAFSSACRLKIAPTSAMHGHHAPVRLFAASSLTTAVVIIATLLSFILGMFESHYALEGQSLASSDSTLLVIAAVVFALFLASLAWKSDTWFSAVFLGLMLACVGILLAMLMAPGALPFIRDGVSVMRVAAMVPVCVYAVEYAKDQQLSPIFVCGTLPALVELFLGAGGALDIVLHNALGPQAYTLSSLAAALLASIAAVVVTLFAITISHAQNKEGARLSTDSDTQGNRLDDAALLDLLMHTRGLSEREAQIAILFSQGRSAPYIGRELALAESTVKSHLKRVYVKLGIHDKQALLDLLNELRDGRAAK